MHNPITYANAGLYNISNVKNDFDLNNIKFLLHKNFDFSTIKKIKKIKQGMWFNTYEIITNEQNLIIKSVKNKKDMANIRKLRLEFNIQNSIIDFFPVAKQIIFFEDYSQIDFPFYISEKINGEKKTDINSIKKSFDSLLKLHNISLNVFDKKNIIIEKNIKNMINKNYLSYKNFSQKENNNIEKIYNWLINNVPDHGTLCLTHNDWHSDNIIFLNNEVVGVLDWELSSISYAELDIGTAMSYLTKEEEEGVLNYLNIEIKNYNFFKNFAIFKLFCTINIGIKNHSDNIINNKKIKDFLELKILEGLSLT